MGIVSAEELFHHLTDPSVGGRTLYHRRELVNNAAPYWQQRTELPASLTLESVEEYLDQIHDRISNGRMLDWKALRPWNIVDLSSQLDQSKAWIGWEVETGWNNSDSRTAVMARFINEFNYVALDEEGPSYGVEFTWSPANEGKYGHIHPLLFIVEVANEEGSGVYKHDPDSSVGTHVNISTPSSRKLEEGGLANIANALNLALNNEFNYELYEEVFGRGDMYGGFFPQRGWIEGKLFNTTYDESEAKRYAVVAERLAEAIEALSAFILESEDGRVVDGEWFLRVRGLLSCLRDGSPVEVWVSSTAAYFDGHDLYQEEDYSDDFCSCDDCREARGEF